jgi:hypothetical protein
VPSGGFWDCRCRLVWVFSRAFKFEPTALMGNVRLAPAAAPAGCIGMAATIVTPDPVAGSAWPCSATGVRSVN